MWLREPFPAPDFPQHTTWVNSEPLSFDQRRSVWLLHFWDYTESACLSALPYLAEWHRRYGHRGLAIVGVHSPRFRFARQRHLVEWALREFRIEYPVVLDNYHHLWRAYVNDSWPTQYLIDVHGRVRMAHLGVGRYDEVETGIHLLLRELTPSVDLPPIMRPMETTDDPDAHRYPVTQDLYAGYERGRFGDPDGYVYDHTVMYEDPGDREAGVLYAQGQWYTTSDYLALLGEQGYLAFVYYAGGVDAVISSTWDEMALMLRLHGGPAPRVGIWLDGGPVPTTEAGADLARDRQGYSFVVVDRPRLFSLTRHPHFGRHELRLTFSDPNVAAYVFTFLSPVHPHASGPIRGRFV
jgi:hypothetical protein